MDFDKPLKDIEYETKKYMLISMVAVTLASCGDDFWKKNGSNHYARLFETETGVEQLIVSTYDALRVTKQYQQGPFTFLRVLII